MRAPWLVLILTVILDPLLLLGEAVCHRNDTNLSAAGQRSGETLSRRRRELTFPKGSAFVMTLVLLKAIQLNEPKNWNLDLEFDVIWPIPSQEDLKKVTIKRPSKLKRRHRRELYANLELALDSQNLPGRLCILRTICEAKTVLSPPGFSIIEDAIRIILRNFEDADNYDCYDIAYRTSDCEVVYPCPFSLLKLLLYNLYTGETRKICDIPDITARINT
ncbi:PREDICTED: uncharacterized protein LOC108762771 [Trachymyrmex cornetzi]|uniref:uncharacterized protein LOC108762771 n=1 Tax=Trachymyrmex cornetzi TaxID=471704 RepID=UPI00084F39E1|nr:PREDICTED: uncharacterized protein LOC108762771 [Trachymyrmex cornetzi]